MARIDREWMAIETLKVVKRLLTKENTMKIQKHNPFRKPTKKEQSKHLKLIKKQRRYLSRV